MGTVDSRLRPKLPGSPPPDRIHREMPHPPAVETPTEPTDAELVQRANDGDRLAFTTLVRRHQRQLYRLALRMLGNDAEAEEVLQETFLHAYRKLPEFRGESAFNSWVYRIAANACLMRLRRRRRSPETLAAEAPTLDLPGPQFSPDGSYVNPLRSDWSLRADDAMHAQQVGTAIRNAVANLSEEYRAVFLLKDVDGLSNEEIADALELTVPAVKSRLHRARLALREALQDHFDPRA